MPEARSGITTYEDASGNAVPVSQAYPMPTTVMSSGGGSAAAAFTTTQNALSTTSEVVIAANTARVYAEVKNTDTAINIYLGKDTGVTTSTGHLLRPGEAFGFEDYAGPIWAIAASGTPTVTTIEW